MPAAAVASFTPAIAGRSGTRAGASGDTVEDMEAQSEASRRNRIVMAALQRGHDACRYYRLKRRNREFYFFAGAILLSAGLAVSGLASVLMSGLASDLAVSSGLSMRSTLAASRSLAT